MTECSSRKLQYGCLYHLFSVTAEQRQSSRTAGLVLQLNKHLGAQCSQRVRWFCWEYEPYKALLSQSLMQGSCKMGEKGRSFLMAERVSSFTEFPSFLPGS